MAERRRRGRWVLGLVCLGLVAGGVAITRMQKAKPHRAATTAAAVNEKTPLAQVAERIRTGDAQALAVLFERVMARPDGLARGLSETEARDWVAALGGMRTGYTRFSAYGRASIMTITGRILGKFAIEQAPASWIDALPPSHDLFTAGLSDSEMNVRLAALEQTKDVWAWLPGCSTYPAQDDALAAWKEAFLAPVVRRLAEPQPILRSAAITCLAALPIDSAAAPAVAYLNDPSVEVRAQVIMAFAGRPALLTEELLLRHVSDSDPRIPPLVERVLAGRGLSKELIGLGAMIMHPRPEVRESVIPMLVNRTDIDPVAWLVYLSRDPVESVRLKAAEALAGRAAVEARQRLAEMALSDPSATVKKAAGKLVVPGEETASLPPLPGSPSLTPKAN